MADFKLLRLAQLLRQWVDFDEISYGDGGIEYYLN
jgi:hypothetical protein